MQYLNHIKTLNWVKKKRKDFEIGKLKQCKTL